MNRLHSFAFVTALFLALLAVVDPVHAADPSADEVDAIFADYDSTVTPGCALGVIREGQLVYKRGYGMANLEYGIALTPSSVFRTASVGKQFTAMAIAILDETGILSLDDPLSQYFPEFPEWAETITIRHLVHHTSGLRDYLSLAWLAGKGDEEHYTDEFALELLARQQNLNFAPGDEHLYSNSGYLLLAHTVKRATGKTLREWAAENMFGPLGMRHSHFHDDHTHLVPLRADGYAPTEDGFQISMTTLDMVGDGGVYTTIEDFLSWDRNFYDNKLANHSSKLIETVTTPSRLNDGEDLTYAFGLDVDRYRGLELVSHGGAFVGFRADTKRFPDQRFSVVVYCNRGDADPGELSRKVADLYLADLMEADLEATVSDSTTAAVDELGDIDFETLAGHYWNEERRATREIVSSEGKLLLAYSDESRLELIPQDSNRFVIEAFGTRTDLEFETTSTDEVQLRILFQDNDTPRVLQRFTPRQVAASDLERYAGTYFSAELGVDYVLGVSDGTLGFSIVRHRSHELEPLFDEIFSSDDYGIFEFKPGPNGSIDRFVLDAGRARNLVFRRQ